MVRKTKLELKGKNINKLPEDKKIKMEATLERMGQARQIDSDRLRDLIIEKLKWAETEKVKGESLKQELLKKQESLKLQMSRIEGIIIFINDLLQPKEEIK